MSEWFSRTEGGLRVICEWPHDIPETPPDLTLDGRVIGTTKFGHANVVTWNGYDSVDPQWMSCQTCGATVQFANEQLHADWHAAADPMNGEAE